MTEQVNTHETKTTLSQAAPAQVYVGGDITLQARVSCSLSCDLRDGKVEIVNRDAVLKQIELTAFDGEVNETEEFVLQAPTEPGEYTWTAVYAEQKQEDVLHEPSSAAFSFVVKPHTISLSLWDTPFPVELDSSFTLKAGARCSAGCKLTGEKIEIYDQQGAKLATGTLGEDPWQDTTAMYWTELELQAPSEEDIYKWELKCPKPDLEPRHEGSAHTFTFRTAKPPEHVVTVEVTKEYRKTPVEEALVSLYSGGVSYRGFTDGAGLVRLNVPKGEYNFAVSAADYLELEGTIEVAADMPFMVELSWFPEV